MAILHPNTDVVESWQIEKLCIRHFPWKRRRKRNPIQRHTFASLFAVVVEFLFASSIFRKGEGEKKETYKMELPPSPFVEEGEEKEIEREEKRPYTAKSLLSIQPPSSPPPPPQRPTYQPTSSPSLARSERRRRERERGEERKKPTSPPSALSLFPPRRTFGALTRSHILEA